MVNQSAFLALFFFVLLAIAVIEHLHFDAVAAGCCGLSGFERLLGLAQTKTPELPPELEVLPLGDEFEVGDRLFASASRRPACPCSGSRRPSSVQVSGSQLTLTKSASPSARQPGPLPSMRGFGQRGGLVGRAGGKIDNPAAHEQQEHDGQATGTEHPHRGDSGRCELGAIEISTRDG